MSKPSLEGVAQRGQLADPPRRPRYSIRVYVRAAVYFTLYGTVKYLPSPIGDILRSVVLRVFAKSVHTWWIKDGVTVWFPEGVSVGAHVSINEGVFIDGYGEVEIGDYCRIAHGCSIVSENHVFADPTVPICLQGKVRGKIVIGRDVWLGTGVKVLQGVTIGYGSVVGAASVVTKSLPPLSIAVGAPARVIGRRGGPAAVPLEQHEETGR
jgi:acetyltransferase-like isoleucine patch superfamily enzyme